MKATMKFSGNKFADLFTKELEKSLQGALIHNYVAQETDLFPKGFAKASKQSNVWDDTCWTRDCGSFLREIAMRGYIEEATNITNYLIDYVTTNESGFNAFPVCFRYHDKGHGLELDGTANICMGMLELFSRTTDKTTRKKIDDFLFSKTSPLYFVIDQLEKYPLIKGSGEFGGGWAVDGTYYNIIQNILIKNMLTLFSDFCRANGKSEWAILKKAADTLWLNITKYMVDENDCFKWSICYEDFSTLDLSSYPTAISTGNINGIAAAMYDGEGLRALENSIKIKALISNTFEKNLNSCALRKDLFSKYGIMTFVDECANIEDEYIGHTSWLSYCNCYLSETAIMLKDKEKLTKSMEWIVASTLYGGNSPCNTDEAINNFNEQLSSDETYWFCERNFSPEWKGERPEGCGKLNLINVAEPLHMARMLVGIDNRIGNELIISPFLPDGWTSFEIKNWQIISPDGTCYMDLYYEVNEGKVEHEISFKNVIGNQPKYTII